MTSLLTVPLWPRAIAGIGLLGCALLAASLPGASVIAGVAVLVLGSAVWTARVTFRRRPGPRSPVPLR